MAVIKQDDLGTVEFANSYVSSTEYIAYMLVNHGITIPYTEPEDITAVDASLVQARSYEDTRYMYKGAKLAGRDQTTRFPSTYIYDCSTCPPFEITGVPVEIKNAQCEYAYIQSEQGTLQPSESLNGGIQSEESAVGSLKEKIVYCGCGSSGGVISYPIADNKIPESFYNSDDGSYLDAP
jgi:hypothetical protein